MSKLLMESLKLDMPALAKLIQARGRKGDTILAHISPKEAALLKKRGGAGTINPDTGLPEFDEGEGVDAYAGGSEQQIADQNAANQTPSTRVSPFTDTISTPADTSGGYGLNYGKAPVSTAIPTTDASGQSYNYYPGAEQQSYATPGLSATTQYGIQPALPSLQPSLAQAPFGAIEGTTSGVSAAPTKPDEPSWTDKLTKAITDPNTLARLGLVGGLGVLGTQKAKQAAAQNQAAQAEQTALGAPYQQMGKQMVAQGQAGELTPSSQAAYQAAQARLNQDIATRGGVGVQQAANQSAALYSQLLQNQTQYGLQVAGIGDSYQINAIQTGLALDQQTNQNLQNYYAALSAVAFGIPMRTTTP